MANRQPGGENQASAIRIATSADRDDIALLMRTAQYQHVHLDWQPPVDWLGDSGFVVLPRRQPRKRSLLSGFSGTQSNLRACLAVTADPAPAAWVRLACLYHDEPVLDSLATLLAAVTPHLQQTGVSQVGWLALEPWPNRWLPQLGFTRINEIETYATTDLDVVDRPFPSSVTIRPATAADMPLLAQLEAAAFAPLWRHSSSSLTLAFGQSFSFDVATWQGRIVGFQFSTRTEANAHLARITVAPDIQGQGVGTALLNQAFRTYRQRGIRRVSLNTQVDNVSSQQLYHKFGFAATRYRLPLWAKRIHTDI